MPELDANYQLRWHIGQHLSSGTTSQAIVLFYDPPRCVKVMEPALDRFLPVKPLYIREADATFEARLDPE